MTKPLYRHLAVLSLLSLTQFFATIPGHAADNEVPVVVKIAGIPWFSAMEKGIKEASKDTGLDAYMVGPTTADPAQQVRLVEDLVAKKHDMILAHPNLKGALIYGSSGVVGAAQAVKKRVKKIRSP